MQRWGLCGLVSVLTATAVAQPTPTVIARDPVWIPATPPRDVSDRIVRFEHLLSGRVHINPPVGRPMVGVFDSLSNPEGDPNLPLNSRTPTPAVSRFASIRWIPRRSRCWRLTRSPATRARNRI